MIELQQNRYLWVHFAGLAFVPLLLDICLAGLASAGPALPFGGQFWAIALLGITPALAMQWLKPFYVFSLPPSALKPNVLTDDQRRCLQIFKSWQIKALAVAVAILSLWLLVQMYALSPQISPLLTPRAGLVCAAIAFFTASSFMQISVSAGRALLIGPTALKRVTAVEESAIARDFLILGVRVKKLLPEIVDAEVDSETVNKEQSAREKTTESVTLPVEEKQLKEKERNQKNLEDIVESDQEISDQENTTQEDTTVPPSKEFEADEFETEPSVAAVAVEAPKESDIPEETPATSAVLKESEVSEESEVLETTKAPEEPEIIIPETLPPEDKELL